jgi:two-component system sensor histidine kinase RegB
LSLLFDEEFGQRARSLRLGTLVRLRWLAVAGQTITIVAVYFGLRVHFPIWAALACTAASASVNLWLRWRFPVSYRLDDTLATRLLGLGILELALLLLLSGGLANPFSIFFLAPLATSAVNLPWRKTAELLSLALICMTALEFASWPLQAQDGSLLAPPRLLNIGTWIAMALGAIFVSIYGNRVSTEARQIASALSATEIILTRAQHLSQLDGLAAAAAHELGTPLATVALVVHELAAQPDVAKLHHEDLDLAEEQIARCRKILGKLSAPSQMASEVIKEANLGELLEEIVTPHRLQDVDIEVLLEGYGEPPICGRNPAVLYGLTNLIENAVGFAGSLVVIEADWSVTEVAVTISDDGPGFPPQVLQHLGEPYISDRAGARRGEGEAAGGLGLGLFIAKSLLERSGARLEISNRTEPERGAVASILWARRNLERGASLRRHESIAEEAR